MPFLDLQLQDLKSIPFHDTMSSLLREIALGSPYHIAIHTINALESNECEYVKPHKHEADELNIILSDDPSFQFKILVGEEEKIVNAPSVVWIPKNTIHSANVLYGKGYYICIIFEKEYMAYNDK